MSGLNLIAGPGYADTPDTLKWRYGFYILCRVRHHHTFTEDADVGWIDAQQALQNLWFSFRVIDRDAIAHPPEKELSL